MTHTLCFDAPDDASAAANLGTFIVRQANLAAEELDLGWRPAVVVPKTLADLRAELRACHLTGLPLRVDGSISIGFAAGPRTVGHAADFWRRTRHVLVGAEFDADGQMEVSSCLLNLLIMSGFDAVTPEYGLLHAELVGRACYLGRVGRPVPAVGDR